MNYIINFRLTELENLGHLTADVNKRNIQDMVQRLAYSDWLILHYLAQVSIFKQQLNKFLCCCHFWHIGRGWHINKISHYLVVHMLKNCSDLIDLGAGQSQLQISLTLSSFAPFLICLISLSFILF